MKIKNFMSPTAKHITQKNISKILALGVLLNNTFNIYSNANNIESLTRYETLEGEVITLDDIKEDDITEIEIFGNTVQDENNLEDIQSVGELYVNEQGQPILDDLGREQYKIEIESCNENLIDGNLDSYMIGRINPSTGELLSTNKYGVVLKDFFEIPPQAYLTGYIDEPTSLIHDFYIYDNNKKFIKRVSCYQKTPDNGRYCKIFIGTSIVLSESQIPEYTKNIRVRAYFDNYNDRVFSYIPHQSNKTTILLPCQLQKVGNVYDRLYWDDEKGRYVVEKNVMEFTINEDAINISINSSLPYSLNAYIVENITSSDKSKTMDLDVLNIKERDEINYQKFDSIGNKLVLKDNCVEGNGINHSIDLKLDGNNAHKSDIYKTTIKFEVEQK